MKQILLLLGILISTNMAIAQNVGIGTATPKDLSKLDVESTTSGFLLPRMTTAQRNTLGGNVSALGAAISAQYNGLMVYDITNNTLYMWDSNKTDFANGGWNNVLDADASVNDADADPSNELQTLSQSGTSVTLSNGGGTISVADNDNSTTNEIQDLSLSGNTLSLSDDATTVNLAPYLDNTDDQKIDVFSLSGNNLQLSLESDGEATKTVDLSGFKDHDWYEVGTTNQPDNIADNIFTNGRVGVNNSNPSYQLQVGAGNGDGITIGNYNDRLGWDGTGAAPELALRFAGYRDVVSNFIGAKIAAIRTNICCSGLSQGNELSFQIQEGTAAGSGDANLVEKIRLGNYGLRVLNLAGTGNRDVYANSNGDLVVKPIDVAYYVGRGDYYLNNTNAGYRVAGAATGNLYVETGDVVTITITNKFWWTGGSGGDHEQYGLRITGACGTINDYEAHKNGTSDDVPRSQEQSMSHGFVWVATCTGNVQFSLLCDNNSQADDNSYLSDVVVIATRH